MSFQAANKLGPTQMLKIFTQSTPHIVLNEGGATAAQSVVLEVFPTNADTRPFFSLGIVSLKTGGRSACYELGHHSVGRRESDEPTVENFGGPSARR